MNLADHHTSTLILAAVVGTLSVGRTARLLIHDSLPPMVWLRSHIVARYKEDSEWATLWECPFCMTPWLTAGMIGWMWLADLNTAWWLINTGWACSWLAAIAYAYDQPD